MDALISLPAQLKDLPIRMNKINKTVYHQPKTNTFYKITVLEPITAFIGEDVVSRQNLVMTKYNPCYLALQILQKSPTIDLSSLPPYLPAQFFTPFTNKQNSTLTQNLQKILDFLTSRIENLQRTIEEKQYAASSKKLDFVNKSGKKEITKEILSILRHDIPAVYMDQLLMTRFKMQVKFVVEDRFEDNQGKDDKEDRGKKDGNKKKSVSKSSLPQVLPKNQKTLFNCFKDKKDKNPEP